VSASGEATDRCSLRALVRGYVQGVNFRQFVYTRARSLKLTGGVSNLNDGTVEVMAEGPRHDLEQLLERLREGPSSARVDEVDVRWGEATERWTDFEIGR
jgi:acylphosphatase